MPTSNAARVEGTDLARDVPELDRRALSEYLTVLEDVGRVRDAAGLYLVVSQSGREYLVDLREGGCTCPDREYRDRKCKHVRRVEFATGRRPVPSVLEVDPQLGLHVESGPEFVDADE